MYYLYNRCLLEAFHTPTVSFDTDVASYREHHSSVFWFFLFLLLCIKVLLQCRNLSYYPVLNLAIVFSYHPILRKFTPPRKENNSKPPTGGNVLPRERTIKVNPNRGKQGGIPKKESPGIANPKGDTNRRQT